MRPIWDRGNMWGDTTLALAATILLPWILPCKSQSAPGRPKLTSCRSPEKETFTCWWEPGSTGGLPTTHRLFYRKERSEKVLECPDYHSAGNNSCFFNKAHTSIWVIYNITVIASNTYGDTFSESVEVDVMDIVQPHSPENVTLTVLGAEDNPYFLVQWEAPHDTDTRSGWVTLKYEVRVKLENSRLEQASEWEVYSAGKQKELSIYSPQPGGRYAVQVRCRLDQGSWSEWSPATFIKVPNNYLKERSVVIFIATVSAFIFLVTIGTLTVKREHVKHCLLPPVPGPKIKGFDAQLLKTEKSEDLFSALTAQGFPPTAECPDQVDYLVVVDSEENSEEFGSTTSQEHQKKDHLSSDPEDGVRFDNLCTVKELNIIQTDTCKRPAVVHDRQDCDTKSTPGISQTLTGTFSSQLNIQHSNSTVPQQELDPDQAGSQIKSEYSCMSSFDQNNASVIPNGFMEYVEENERQDCKLTSTTEGGEGEDYSKVSGVYSDSVLVLQKARDPIHKHKERNCDDLHKKIKGEKTLSAKDVADTQDYVTTM
ncbi:prolactin receptor b [Colossoma macropomum]|uniref:prolactin receptor b n=1 Tax=Colossoma macropomum TaxID=42526 RepID=UPI001864FABA|nr:prolactin receptor b [Colossoma macropomum]